jgi:uncharacterized membrane protein YkvA (DUF1232 family)
MNSSLSFIRFAAGFQQFRGSTIVLWGLPLFIGRPRPDIRTMQGDIEIPNQRVLLPAVIERNERIVRDGFWKKLLKKAGRVPFAEELATAYYCLSDPATPPRVRGLLLGALAYFVVPVDAIPDFVAGIGFTDDAAVLAAAIALVSRYILPEHREQARRALHLSPRDDRA